MSTDREKGALKWLQKYEEQDEHGQGKREGK
jgi:hypothetical protein